MDIQDSRAVLARLIRESGEDCAAISRLIGRNAAYVQQFIKRGTPRRLAEADRERLARYFGVPEAWLGAPAERVGAEVSPLRTVPVFDTAASAGPGAVGEDRPSTAGLGFSEEWLRRLRPGGGSEGLSVIRVRGDSMLPTLSDGDEILVDATDGAVRLRVGIYVLRLDGVLMVKRIGRHGTGFAVTSDNPAFGAVRIEESAALDIVGRVLWAGRRLL